MATYSFMDVTATFAGPTGVIDLGYGSAASKEGISVEFNQPRNNMTPGADGEVMHSLRADKSGKLTIRLLYTSPVNAKLKAMFNAQSLSSSAWGNNVITVLNKGNTTRLWPEASHSRDFPVRPSPRTASPSLNGALTAARSIHLAELTNGQTRTSKIHIAGA